MYIILLQNTEPIRQKAISVSLSTIIAMQYIVLKLSLQTPACKGLIQINTCHWTVVFLLHCWDPRNYYNKITNTSANYNTKTLLIIHEKIIWSTKVDTLFVMQDMFV